MNRPIEMIVKKGFVNTKIRKTVINRMSKAKTFDRWIKAKINIFERDNRKNDFKFSTDEVLNIMKECLSSYRDFHETESIIKKTHKRLSKREYKALGGIIEVVTSHGVKDLIRREVEWVADYLDKFDNEQFNSVELGLNFARLFGYDPKTREEYFADRVFQNYWTTLLRYLADNDEITYSGGVITTNTHPNLSSGNH